MCDGIHSAHLVVVFVSIRVEIFGTGLFPLQTLFLIKERSGMEVFLVEFFIAL